MKIIDLKKLVTEVLATLPKPYAENIVDEVFFAIEQNDRFFRIYSECCSNLGRLKVNTAGADRVRKELARTAMGESPAQLSKLIDTYPVLNARAAPAVKKSVVKKARPQTATAKKRLELDARKSLSDYYMANKASLPPQIALYREQILALIKAGVPVAEAFERAVDEEAVAFSS